MKSRCGQRMRWISDRIGYRAIVSVVVSCLLAPYSVLAAVPEAPVAPLIFEKPNSERFEVVWFHPAFHSRVIGNLQEPERYFTVYQEDREGIVASRLSLSAPFAVYRVAAYVDTRDPAAGLPGDGYTPLDLQLTTQRNNITYRPTDIPFGNIRGSGDTGLVTVLPDVAFAGGDSLFVGLQWRAGTPLAPAVGASNSLGGLAEQEFVYRSGAVDRWQSATELTGIEVEALGWRPDTLTVGNGAFSHQLEEPPHFLIWYGKDSLTSVGSSTANAIITSDTLAWETSLGVGGYIMIVAEDGSGGQSAIVKKRVTRAGFKKITLSSAEVTFDWRNPASVTQTIFVTNAALGPVRLRLRTDDSRVSFNDTMVVHDTTLTVGGGGAFRPLTITMSEPPGSGTVERHSLYIYNDSGWLPLKVDLVAIPDIQTSIHDDSPKPLSFEVSEIYPNPNYGSAQFRLVSPQRKMFRVEVYNVLGQLLQSEDAPVFGEAEIPVRLLPDGDLPLAAGIYFVRISSGNESTMRKLVFVK